MYMQANKHYKLLAKQLNKQTLIIVLTLHQDIETNLLSHLIMGSHVYQLSDVILTA